MVKKRLSHIYVDAFAGTGKHLSKATGQFIEGSPLNALQVIPAFCEYHLIDLNAEKVKNLRELTAGRENVFIYEADCNEVLLTKVFPRAKYEDFRRALCLLDPYGLTLNWDVIYEAGQMGSVEIFLNFPIMDMNRNVLRRNPEGVSDSQIARLNAFWGDSSWREAAYTSEGLLFGEVKTDNAAVVAAFRRRLRSVAGFEYIPEPMPMRNSAGSVVYYLFFASPNKTGAKIVTEIFNTYRDRRDL